MSEPDDQLPDRRGRPTPTTHDGDGRPRPPEGPLSPARGIVRASLVGTALFTVLGVLGAVWPDVFGPPFLVVSLVEFLVGTVAFVLAFLRAVGRSRTEAIGIGGLFFPAGSRAPAACSGRLIGSLVVQIVVAIVVGSRPPLHGDGLRHPGPDVGARPDRALGGAPTARSRSATPEPTRAALRDADRRAHKAGGSADRRGRTE